VHPSPSFDCASVAKTPTIECTPSWIDVFESAEGCVAFLRFA